MQTHRIDDVYRRKMALNLNQNTYIFQYNTLTRKMKIFENGKIEVDKKDAKDFKDFHLKF